MWRIVIHRAERRERLKLDRNTPSQHSQTEVTDTDIFGLFNISVSRSRVCHVSIKQTRLERDVTWQRSFWSDIIYNPSKGVHWWDSGVVFALHWISMKSWDGLWYRSFHIRTHPITHQPPAAWTYATSQANQTVCFPAPHGDHYYTSFRGLWHACARQSPAVHEEPARGIPAEREPLHADLTPVRMSWWKHSVRSSRQTLAS